MVSPPKPTDTKVVPGGAAGPLPRAVVTWWHPRRWALERVWTRGKVGEVVVLWMRMWEEPEAEIRALEVGEREKISVGWAFWEEELAGVLVVGSWSDGVANGEVVVMGRCWRDRWELTLVHRVEG